MIGPLPQIQPAIPTNSVISPTATPTTATTYSIDPSSVVVGILAASIPGILTAALTHWWETSARRKELADQRTEARALRLEQAVVSFVLRGIGFLRDAADETRLRQPLHQLTEGLHDAKHGRGDGRPAYDRTAASLADNRDHFRLAYSEIQMLDTDYDRRRYTADVFNRVLKQLGPWEPISDGIRIANLRSLEDELSAFLEFRAPPPNERRAYARKKDGSPSA